MLAQKTEEGEKCFAVENFDLRRIVPSNILDQSGLPHTGIPLRQVSHREGVAEGISESLGKSDSFRLGQIFDVGLFYPAPSVTIIRVRDKGHASDT